MEIYFYCSYEHSKRGFFMTKLEGDALVPAESGESTVPDTVRDFFSYDRFQFLWRDLCRGVEKPWQKPECTGSFCGIRELHGRMSGGRGGVINLAFQADAEEQMLLRRTVLAILGDFDTFCSQIFGWMTVGGECGYELDGAAFRGWIEQCGKCGHLIITADEDAPALRFLPYLNRSQAPRLERDTLRLAACTCSWNEIYEVMGNRLVWYLKPHCAITVQEFEAAFPGQGQVWKLEAEALSEEDLQEDLP